MAGLMDAAAWDARIARAEELAGSYPAAGQLLRFYARVGRFKKDLYKEVAQRTAADP